MVLPTAGADRTIALPYSEGPKVLRESEITRYDGRRTHPSRGGCHGLASGHPLADLSAGGRGGGGADPHRRAEGGRPPAAGARAGVAARGQPPGGPRGPAHAGG